jgi:hypothetical protein
MKVFRWLLLPGLIFFACARPAPTQSRIDLSSGPRGVPYAQTNLFGSLDGPWPAPSPSHISSLNSSLTTVPFGFSEKSSSSSSSDPTTRPDLQPPASTKFRWKPAFGESLLYTGIMQAWRFPTEAGTRDALNSAFLQDYFNSVLATRGWDDGDTVVTSYIAHPMEGAIFGYIERQNDPLYRNVEIGDGRRYWISILRSYAYSTVWDVQWTLGPFSEASLGNVQLHDSPGFVDLVGSSTFGMFWILGEDTLDKYGLARLENHTANRPLLVLARSFGNPCRTFANLMAFKKPWDRPNRPGLFGENFLERSEYIRARKDGNWEGPDYVHQWRDFNHIDTGIDWRPHTGPYPAIPDFELIANLPIYETFLGGGSCIGGGGSGSVQLRPQFALVSEVSGCMVIDMPHHQSGDSLSYVVGPRWAPRAAHRASPYVQVLFGGRRVSYEIDYPDVQKRLMKEWNDGNGTFHHYPMRKDYTYLNQINGWTLAAGGGVDLRLNSAFALRVADIEYTHTWMPDVNMIKPQDGIRLTSGLILRIGTW